MKARRQHRKQQWYHGVSKEAYSCSREAKRSTKLLVTVACHVQFPCFVARAAETKENIRGTTEDQRADEEAHSCTIEAKRGTTIS